MSASAIPHPPVQHIAEPPSRGRRLCLSIFTLLVTAGCAQPRHATQAPGGARPSYWSGRLALQVDGQASQSFAAAFELQGNAVQGELTLLSPLGSVLAHLTWEPGHARLKSNNKTSTSASLDELLSLATGSSIPVSALFDWLQGVQTTATGWQADLSALNQGRIGAWRQEPGPRATLRIALER